MVSCMNLRRFRWFPRKSYFLVKGTAVTVFGSLDNSNGTSSPQWLCTIDGVAIESTINPGSSQISQPLCTASGLTGGVHNLSVTIPPSVPTFNFDYVFYTPSSTASLANARVIPNDDPELFTWLLTGDRPDQPWFSFYGSYSCLRSVNLLKFDRRQTCDFLCRISW